MGYATWNPADKHANIALSNGNLTATASDGDGGYSARSSYFQNTGKWYCEFSIVSQGGLRIGIGLSTANLSEILGNWGNGVGIFNYSDTSIKVYYEATDLGEYGSKFVNGDIIQLAVDFDNLKVWVGKNGTWLNSGDPAAGTGNIVTLNAGSFSMMMSADFALSSVTANFGASAFAYTVPSGFNSGWYDTPPESSPYERTIEDTFGAADVVMSNAFDSIDEALGFSSVLGEKHFDIFEETIDFFDQAGLGNVYLNEIEDGADFASLALWQLGIPVLDTFATADEVTDWLRTLWIYESLVCTDLSKGDYGQILRDTLFIYEELKHGWNVTVPDALDVADAVSKVLNLLISEWITLIDSQVNNWDGQEIVPEALNLYDLAKDIQQYSKTVDESLVTTDTANYRLCLTVLEYLRFTELAAAMRSFTQTASESLTLVDGSTRGFEKTIADALSAVDVSSVITTFLNTIAESLTATDAASLIGRLGASVAEPLVIADTIASQGTLYSAVYETLHMNVTVEIDGEIWECYVLNTPKFHPSMYSGFDFNSYCVFEGRAYGANDTGIYELTGDTDAGATIHTGAILSETDFGSPNQKRFRRGYLGITGDAPVMVFQTESGQREVYSINTEGKVVASSDLKSKNWKLSIADFDELKTIKLIPVILTK